MRKLAIFASLLAFLSVTSVSFVQAADENNATPEKVEKTEKVVKKKMKKRKHHHHKKKKEAANNDASSSSSASEISGEKN